MTPHGHIGIQGVGSKLFHFVSPPSPRALSFAAQGWAADMAMFPFTDKTKSGNVGQSHFFIANEHELHISLPLTFHCHAAIPGHKGD